MAEIGILFDIDELGGGLYGSEAFKIIYKNLDPNEMSNFSIFDGDTNSTLAGNDRLYCIAIKSMDANTIDYVENVMGKADDKGLAPVSSRFLKGHVTSVEPLVYSAEVTNAIIEIKGGGPPSWGLTDEYKDKWTGKLKVEKKETAKEEEKDYVLCPSCGNRNPKNAKFCQGCGGPLNEEAAKAAPQKPEKALSKNEEILRSQDLEKSSDNESYKTKIIVGYALCALTVIMPLIALFSGDPTGSLSAILMVIAVLAFPCAMVVGTILLYSYDDYGIKHGKIICIITGLIIGIFGLLMLLFDSIAIGIMLILLGIAIPLILIKWPK